MNIQKVKHVAGVIYRIWKWLLWGLRWLVTGAVGLLFLAGVFVSLPWKILACLAVVLLVGIFAPKRAQPWCWAAITAIVIGVAVWVYWPQQDQGRWRTYRFDPAFARMLQQRRIDNAPNAAPLYEQVLDEHDEQIFMRDGLAPHEIGQTLAEPWCVDAHPDIAQWLRVFEPSFARLATAAAIDQCRFPFASDVISVRTQLRRLNQLKGWRNLLIRSANSDLHAGRLDEALHKKLTVLAIARHLYQQQTLFDQAAAFSLEVSAARVLRRYVLEYAEQAVELDRILAAMERLEPNWPFAWDGVVEHEKLIAKNTAGLLYEIDDRGRTRIHRSAIASVGQGLGYPIPAGLHQDVVGRTAAVALWLSIPVSPDSTARLIERRFDRFSELARRGEAAPTLPIHYAWRLGLNPTSAVDWLARNQMSYYVALDGQHTRHLALRRVTAISVELRRYYLQHGRWPESFLNIEARLDPTTFIDPLSGVDFAYVPTETDFYLYSFGRNAIDDGGRFDLIRDFDDIVFWPLDGAVLDVDLGLEPDDHQRPYGM